MKEREEMRSLQRMCCYYVDLEQKGATTGSKWFNRKEAEKKEVRGRTRSQKTFHFTRASHTKTMRNECGLIGEAGEGRDRVISYVSWVKDGTKIFNRMVLFIYLLFTVVKLSLLDNDDITRCSLR